ncbi:hypothetical protein FNB79_10040 [Formosa sediminum]|uniref:DUF6250 domain-containing protein n=1 Tax=Formosa sediminum TaxID=2594004 RepID=A0A516GS00_9FLAO|nr:DUF6250 domain-containing protein [Formosa sediminum]QDO94292.1 hypothetical protein FNB79_10040 [Formosa sediminum]
MIRFQIYRQSTISAMLIMVAFLFTSCGDKTKAVNIKDNEVKAELIFEEDFDSDLSQWKVEQMPGGTVQINEGKLEIDDVSGCTVWLTKPFEGSVQIEYDVFLIQDNGPNDRVSDLNCFWMATDPKNPSNLFAESEARGGKFSNYDSLKLYYMGVGGNDNKTTRFRRYVGNGERPLLPENDLSDEKYMLEPNTPYHIKIIAHGSTIQYYRNDMLLVDFNDNNPYTSGYFGLRTVKNHMTVDNFKVYKLKE